MGGGGGGGGADLQRLTGMENVLLGATAGACAKCVNYPIMVLKNHAQQGIQTQFHPRLLYRGLPMAVINMSGTTMVQFGTTGAFQKMLRSASDDDTTVQMGGALLGGLASGVPCSLWELVMVQQQRVGGTLVGTPLKLVRDHGVAVLSRGLTMTLGREALFTLSMLGVTPWIQHKLHDSFGLHYGLALAFGALAGSLSAATLSHPLDTIKTCQQGDVAGKTYGGIAATYRAKVVEAGGFRGLYVGLGWRVTLIATTFFLVNAVKDHIGPVMFPRVAAPM